jgi:NADH-quinone oxidoreductase subunit F
MTKAIVGLATCGIAAGAETVLRSLKEKVEAQKLPVEVGITGCIGMCYQEPLLEIRPDNGDRYIYGRVNEKRLDRVLKQHVQEGNPIEELLVWTNNGLGSDREFLNRQVRIVLRNCGLIDPESIDDYIAQGGYKAIEKAMEELSPDALIGLMIESGLRGRGGAGFPTGMKWRFTRLSPGERKYIICNADEGDPGAFMDRSVLEGDPHSVLEGMIVAGYAIGAHEGYIYVRAEYPKAIERLKIAIEQANAKGFLGERIFGTDFRFIIKIKEGAGAFVCGEETALMKSIEGSRGMPRIRPPFPAVKGLWDFPTSINNVETFANVPWIVLNGAEAYNQYGTELSKGTKVFALAGKINRGGLVEVPMGVTIHDIVDGICGGIKENRRFKAVQIGGPSGGCIPTQLQDTIIDYDSISRTGAIMGSGGMVVMDETTCMVDVAKFFLDFTQRESCGKCTFCRIGTKRMLRF